MSGPRGVPAAVFLRAFAIQGSWNYETLSGTGFGFAILPALRELYRDPAELDAAIRRHELPFNSHPYLAPLALGAVIRLEQDGEDPAVIERFKAALRGSLGTIGDQLVWAGWRPVCALAALGMVLFGIPWHLVVLIFLVVFNVAHVALMTWGLNVGFREGRLVADRLRDSVVRRTQPRLMGTGGFLAGFVAAFLVSGGLPYVSGSPAAGWILVALAMVVAGARWGERIRRYALGAVALLVVVGLALGAAGVVP